MKIQVLGINVDLTPAIIRHAKQRLSAALDQHSQRVRRVQLRIADENGPKGGKDMVCHVAVVLESGQTMDQRRRDRDLYANISLLADSVKHRVGKRLARHKQAARRGLRRNHVYAA